MGIVDVLMNSMWIGTSNHVHTQAAATFDKIAEWVPIAHELAAVMHGNLGWVEGNATARAQASGIDVQTLEVVEPELELVVARIVFYKGYLRPPHGPVIPVGVRLRLSLRLREEGEGGRCDRRLYELTAIQVRHDLEIEL